MLGSLKLAEIKLFSFGQVRLGHPSVPHISTSLGSSGILMCFLMTVH